MERLGAIPLPLACAPEERYPVEEGYLSDTCTRPHESKAKCMTPSAILSRRGTERHGGYLALGLQGSVNDSTIAPDTCLGEATETASGNTQC